jgi:hypothetical protein
MRKLRLACVLTALLALATPSRAQDASDLERAKASFKAGANAYAAGDYLAAIQALESAYAITPLPAIAFSLAQAERKQYFVKEERAHLLRALALFHAYLEQAERGARRDDARLAIAQLEPLLGGKSVKHEPAPKAEARPTRLMIVADAPGARITLDGGAAAGSPLIREVSPGKHHAHVKANGYLDADREVIALAGELILGEVRLSERPSSLYVWAPENADVYVDGVYVAQGGERVTLPLAAGPHQLSVSQSGRKLVRRELFLKRGQNHTEVVTLESTTQRNLAELLFMGGGAALGGSLVLSAFAIRSEDRAEEFLRRQRHENVTTSQLIAYNASLVERDRYRTAAAVSLAGSLGLFITGLFLHELDRPNAPAAPRHVPHPRREAALHDVAFTPTIAPERFGLSLQASF